MNGKITEVKRHPERASYDKGLLLDILSRNFVCEVGFEVDGQPFVIPMTYYNDQDNIYIHASTSSRIAGQIRDGKMLAISVLEINGLVIARAISDNSINYRSALIFGTGREITGSKEKLLIFKEWLDRLIPGRSRDTIIPGENDLGGVAVFSVNIKDFSIKVREGGPIEKSGKEGIWSGVVPIFSVFGRPTFSSGNVPRYIEEFIEKKNSGIKIDSVGPGNL
jgi:nitroimidazol reductase NimA-like FMN-containing flavoprotein (pyridoxamine 5'-phosphate oxidase superfamily)